MSEATIEAVLEFWLGDSTHDLGAAEARRDFWYRGGEALDGEIRERFGGRVAQAARGELSAWEATPDGALALIILLDQFSRNIHRGTPEVYAGDALAREILARAIDRGHDVSLPVVGRIFLYHPLHHAETLAEQDRAVALVAAMVPEVPYEWRAYVERSVEGFSRHRDVVARFGRFPHRNAILGRATTADEQRYLDEGAADYGQRRR